MIIKIDTRETELLQKCKHMINTVNKFKDLTIISETLPLGDAIINDNTNDNIIIERKTLADLASSIKDGRYEEQSYRLNGLNHHNHNIVYLIEGDVNNFNTFKESMDKLTLYSAIFSIQYFKGFSVMRSNNMIESALIICNMAYKIERSFKEKGRTGFYSNIRPILNKKEDIKGDTKEDTKDIDSNDSKDFESKEDSTEVSEKEVSEKNYCNVVKKVKKENITSENIGEIMLCQIPGVSSSSALAILAEFKTLANLIKNIQQDEKCLNNICTKDTNNKSRKISKTAIATIIKFLKN